MGIIVVSLVLASIALPLPPRGLQLPPEPLTPAEEDSARTGAAEAAIAEINRLQNSLSEGQADVAAYVAPPARLMAAYRARIEARVATGQTAALLLRGVGIERTLVTAARNAERGAILRMLHAGQITREIARKLYRELDVTEPGDV